MNLKVNKTLIIALILVMTASLFIASMQSASAGVTEWDTFFYVMVAPDTVGVGQTTIITLQIDKTNPLSGGIVAGERFTGLSAKITKPDGTVETKGPYEAYSMANNFFYYAPTQVGTYTVEGSWPGQWANASTYQRWYKPSSAIATFTVQEEPVPSFSDIPIPELWTRPLNAEIKGWWQIADNWLMPRYDNPASWRFSFSAVAPYTSAPNNAHILWKQPVAFGGVVGGATGDETYRTGLSYEPWYATNLIISGRIYYTIKGESDTAVLGTRCIDLYTGDEIFYLDGVNIGFAQVLKFDSGNEHGSMAYLWESGGGGTYRIYDAFEGKLVYTYENVTSGTIRFGPNGEVLIYSLTGDPSDLKLTLWNSTRAVLFGDPSNQNRVASGEADSYWSPAYLAMVDGNKGIEWSVSVPSLWIRPSISIVQDGYILARYRQPTRPSSSQTIDTQYPPITLDVVYPATLQKQSDGSYPTSINHLWAINRTDVKAHSPSLCDQISEDVYVDFDGALARLYGYDIKTGQKLWETERLEGWGIFSGSYYTGGTMAAAYGMVYNSGYDGHVRGYDIKTGELEWDYYMGDAPYLENAYGTYPMYGFTIADGKIFVTNDEHSPDSILWRGGKLTVLDAENGDVVWSIGARLRHSIISDNILSALNIYDMQIYTFGKGPSKTTVEGPKIAVTLGSSVMITGSVTDQTAASKDTPAISEEDMSAWMEYLHMQKPIPANAKGVEVSLDVIDVNGNYRNIGTATTDISGTFGYMWEPDIPGQYTIMVTFAGSESYASSYAQTYLGVVEKPIPTPQPEATPAPMTDTYLAGSTIAIIAAIGIAVFLLLRKK